MCLSLPLNTILILSITKKGKRTKFLFYIQDICLNDFNFSICFQTYWTYYFFCIQESKFSTIKAFFQSQGTFPKSNHSQGTSPQKYFFYQGSFPQTKFFTHSKYFSANEDQKGSLKAKIVDPFNTKSYAKLFLIL